MRQADQEVLEAYCQRHGLAPYQEDDKGNVQRVSVLNGVVNILYYNKHKKFTLSGISD